MAGCSSTENNAEPDEQVDSGSLVDTNTPIEQMDFCKDGSRYTVAGEDYCVFEGPATDSQYVPTCPEGFTAHGYMVDEQEEGSAPAGGVVFICAKQAEIPGVLTAVLDEILNHRAPSQVATCSVAGQTVSGLCGACDCIACGEDEKTCTHMQCDVSKCGADQLCENQQCVQNPEGEGLTCDNVLERWAAFSTKYVACETAADCVVLNIPGGCDQSMAFAHGGDALNHESARLASPYFEVYQSDACESVRELNKTYDVGPAGETLCTNNRCGYEIQYCNLPE